MRLTIRRGFPVWVTAVLLAIAGVCTPAAAAASAGKPAVLFFGDSLTAGYGLDEPDLHAYPALLQHRIASAGLPFGVINAGLSGETTAAGARRVHWVLRQPVAVFVLALGGNDGLRGIPPAETEKNLQAIITAVQEKYPGTPVVLAGMEAPPNMGPDFTAEFRAIFPRLAQANDLPLIPFLLEGLGGERSLNLADGIHPNVAGQQIVADNIWPVLEPVLRELAAKTSS